MIETATLKSERLISVPPASFQGASDDEPLHSLRSLQGPLCDAKSPRSDTGSTPINHSAKVSFPEQNSPLFIV